MKLNNIKLSTILGSVVFGSSLIGAPVLVPNVSVTGPITGATDSNTEVTFEPGVTDESARLSGIHLYELAGNSDSTGSFTAKLTFDLADLDANRLLWEDGGTKTGTSLLLSTSGTVAFTIDQGDNNPSDNYVTANVSGSVGGSVQLVARFDNATDTLDLWVGPNHAGTLNLGSGSISEWAGGGDYSLGMFQTGGYRRTNAPGFSTFTGDIEDNGGGVTDLDGSSNLQLDFYDSALQGSDMHAVLGVPEPSTYAAIAGAFGLLLALVRRRR